MIHSVSVLRPLVSFALLALVLLIGIGVTPASIGAQAVPCPGLPTFNGPAALGVGFPAHTRPVLSVAFSPNGQILATASEGGDIQLWDLKQPGPIAIIPAHFGAVNAVAFSPNSEYLASVGADFTVRIWTVANPAVSLVGTLVAEPKTVAWNFNGDVLATGTLAVDVGASQATVQLWDPTNLAGGPTLVLDQSVVGIDAMDFRPDGVLATTDLDRLAKLWDLSGAAPRIGPLSAANGGNRLLAVAFSQSGELLLAGAEDGSTHLWNASNLSAGAIANQISAKAITSIAFDPTHESIAVLSSEDGIVRLVDVAGAVGMVPCLPTELPGGPFPVAVRSVAWSPNGQVIAAGFDDGSVQLWTL